MSEKVLVGVAKDSGQVRSEEREAIILDEEGWEDMKEKAGCTLAEQLTGVVMDEILPPEVLETIASDPRVQPDELQIATGGVVVNVPIESVRWFDERKCCRHVFAGVRPEVCSDRVGDPGARREPGKYPAGYCMGYPLAPCAFDDSEFDWLWVEATRLATEEEGITDGIIMPGRKHLEEAQRRRLNEEASGLT